jgi:gallidermin/nisin family lantibiotic
MTVAYESKALNRDAAGSADAGELFDLDIQVSKGSGDVEPQITSYSLCTPGCAKTGSFNSYCC